MRRNTTLPCIVCSKTLESAAVGNSGLNQPHEGMAFTSSGHYGSTLFDSFTKRSFLEINVCDDCLAKKAKQGIILHGCYSKPMPPPPMKVWTND